MLIPSKDPQSKGSMDPREMTVVVLQGGNSVERDVSLRTGYKVTQGLRELGFAVAALDTNDLSFIDMLRELRPNFVFNALHGVGGEDGTIQGLLETMGLPYTGSGVMASALAMNKQVSKDIFDAFGLNTPKGRHMHRDKLSSFDELCAKLECEQLVIKPNSEGSSVGVEIVSNDQQLRKAFEVAADAQGFALIEECIFGREITVAVLGDAKRNAEALPVVEIIPKTDFYHYENKYTAGAVDYVVPAELSPELTKACQDAAVLAHNALGCQGYSRADIRLSKDNIPYLLETNTLPGLTLLPQAAAAAGIDFNELLMRICVHAFQKVAH